MRSVTKVCREAYEREGWSPLIALVAVHAVVIYAGIWLAIGIAPSDHLAGELPGLWMLAVLVAATVIWVAVRQRRTMHGGAAGGLTIAAVGAACRLVFESAHSWVGGEALWPRYIGVTAFFIGLAMFAWAALTSKPARIRA